MTAEMRAWPAFRGGECMGQGARGFAFDDLVALVPHVDAGELAATLGVSRKLIQRRRHRDVPRWMADELAVRAGFHPSTVWSNWFDEVDG
jgi:hypothetical protein